MPCPAQARHPLPSILRNRITTYLQVGTVVKCIKRRVFDTVINEQTLFGSVSKVINPQKNMKGKAVDC